MLNLLADEGKSINIFHNVKSKLMMPSINFTYMITFYNKLIRPSFPNDYIGNPYLLRKTTPLQSSAIGVGKCYLPALRTVRAVLPHTALQSVVSTS
jgi:hypothetical protein